MLTLEHKLPGSFAQLSNVVELGSGRVVFADTRSKLFLSADLASGDVDTLGTRVETITAQSPAGSVQVPRLGRPSRGRHRGAGGLRARSAPRCGTSRASALKVLGIVPAAGTAPVLVYDTVGHAYRIDYQPVLGAGAGCDDRRRTASRSCASRSATGKVDTVAQLAGAGIR